MKYLMSRRSVLSAAALASPAASGLFSTAAEAFSGGKPRLILTGDLGLVGQRLLSLGIFHEYDVVALDRRRGPEENLSIPNGDWLTKFKGASACVHLAWEMRDPLVYEVAAIQATVNVLEACCFYNVPRVVFSSSAWADPAKYGAKINKISQSSYYGAAKRFIEDSMRLYSAETVSAMAAIRLGRVAPDIEGSPDDAFGPKIWMSDTLLRSVFSGALTAATGYTLMEPMLMGKGR